MERLAAEKLLGNLTLELDGVGPVPRHGLSSESRPPGQSKFAYLSGARGPLQTWIRSDHTWEPKSPRLLLFAAVGGLPARLRPSSLSVRTKRSDDAKLKG